MARAIRNAVIASTVAVLSAASVCAATTAKVSAVLGKNRVTLSLGARDGVQQGMTGQIKATVSAGDRTQDVQIAAFRVTEVKDKTSVAELTAIGSGFRVEAGNDAVFDHPLTAAQHPSAAPSHHPVAGQTAVLPPTTPTPATSQDAMACAAIAQTDAPAAFEEYLRQFPNGSCAAFARVKLAATKPAAPVAPSTPGNEAAAAATQQVQPASAATNEAAAGSGVDATPQPSGTTVTTAAVPSAVTLTPEEMAHSRPAFGLSIRRAPLSLVRRAGLTEWEPALVTHVVATGPAAGLLKDGDVLLEQKPLESDPTRFVVRLWRNGERLEVVLSKGDSSTIFKNACLQGDPVACSEMGWSSDPESSEYFSRACQGGVPRGCAFQGGEAQLLKACNLDPFWCYDLGERQEGKARLQLLDRACAAENALACSVLGFALESKRESLPRAIKLHEAACEAHRWASCQSLYRLQRKSPGLQIDAAKWVDLLAKGCDDHPEAIGPETSWDAYSRIYGQAKACFMAGRAAGDSATAIAFFSRGCRLNSSGAIFRVDCRDLEGSVRTTPERK